MPMQLLVVITFSTITKHCCGFCSGDLFLCVHAAGSDNRYSMEGLSDSRETDWEENHHQRVSGLR